MYSKVILVGNLTRDVEIRHSQSGTAFAKTAIATSHKWKTQAGEQKEEVMFIDLTFVGRAAEVANQYLHKGSKVLVDGRLVLEQWTAQDGTKRSKHSITVETMKMLGSKEAGQLGGGQPSDQATTQRQDHAPQSQPEPTQQVPEIDIDEYEIPF